jgi:hypothetical protein
LRAEKAAARYREAVAIDPGFAEAHFDLGVAMDALDRPADAVSAREEAARRSKDGGGVRRCRLRAGFGGSDPVDPGAGSAHTGVKIRRAPVQHVLLCLFAGAVVPLLVYVGRRHATPPWLWSLPPHPTSRVAIAAASVVAAGLAVAGLGALVERVGGRTRRIARVALAACAVSAAIAALHQWPYTGVSGDAAFWVRMASDPFIMSSEPLGRWSHYLAFRIHGLIGEPDRLAAVRWSSVAAGGFYLSALIPLACRTFSGSRSWVLAAFLFIVPSIEVFAGYPETTPWVYAFTGIYLLAGVRYLEAGLARPPWIESLLLLVALWTHGVACFATGAHAVLMLCWWRSSQAVRTVLSPQRRAMLAVLLALLPFAALAATFAFAYAFGTGLATSPWYGNALGGGGGQWVFLSEATKPPGAQYALLNRRHVEDLATLVLLACPLLLVVPVAARELLRDRRQPLAFLAAALAGLLLFSLFWYADYGMQRDYDLMAMFTVPAHLIVALWLDARFGPRQRGVIVLASICSAFACRVAPFLHFP